MQRLNYIPEIDAIRGFGVILSLLFHSKVPFTSGGFIMIDLFFVISGYMITALLVIERKNSGEISIRDFYWRRFLRIVPPVVSFLSAFVVFAWFFLPKSDFFIHLQSASYGIAYMFNIAQVIQQPVSEHLMHLWSLSVEEQFYLVWPFCLLLLYQLFKGRWIPICVALFLLACLLWYRRWYLESQGTGWWIMYLATDTRAYAIVFGCLLGVLLPYQKEYLLKFPLKKILGPLAILAMIYTGIIFAFFDYTDRYIYKGGSLLFVIISCCAIAYLELYGSARWLAFIFKNRFFIYVGKMCYGFYLWHLPFVVVLLHAGFHWSVVAIVSFFCTLAIASFSYFTLEKYCFSKKNFIKDRMRISEERSLRSVSL